MAWKENKMVGIIAAIVVVVGVVLVYRYMIAPAPVAEHGGMTFECESTGQTFKITDADLDNADVYSEYMSKAGQPVKCKFDDKKDAYWVYYCPIDKKYFRYTAAQGVRSDILKCPNGHEIEEQYR